MQPILCNEFINSNIFFLANCSAQMGKINSTFSGGYYHAPDFDVFQTLQGTQDATETQETTKTARRKVTHMVELALQCVSCSHFIARMTKVNAHVEATGEKYLGVALYRLSFKCPNCREIIKLGTDPQSRGYIVESGATNISAPWKDRMEAVRQLGDAQRETIIQSSTQESAEQRIEKARKIQEETDSLYELRWNMNEREERAKKLLSGLRNENIKKSGIKSPSLQDVELPCDADVRDISSDDEEALKFFRNLKAQGEIRSENRTERLTFFGSSIFTRDRTFDAKRKQLSSSNQLVASNALCAAYDSE